MKRLLNHPWFFWFILAIPSIAMARALSGGADPGGLLHPTGEFAARFMIIAMMLSPLLLLFRNMNWRRGWISWLIKRRRALGVAAFLYALAHTVLYVVDVKRLQDMLAELWTLGIWTGWLAFAIFIPLAVTSNDTSTKAMGRRWKSLQRWVYPAAVLTLVHWIFVHNHLGPALVHFVPLALLELYRVIHFFKNSNHKQTIGATNHEQ